MVLLYGLVNFKLAYGFYEKTKQNQLESILRRRRYAERAEQIKELKEFNFDNIHFRKAYVKEQIKAGLANESKLLGRINEGHDVFWYKKHPEQALKFQKIAKQKAQEAL